MTVKNKYVNREINGGGDNVNVEANAVHRSPEHRENAIIATSRVRKQALDFYMVTCGYQHPLRNAALTPMPWGNIKKKRGHGMIRIPTVSSRWAKSTK